MKNSASDILNHFKNKINLSDYLSKFINLEKRGNSHVGKCPFHNDKTPSFSVSDEKGLFYCFGCGVGGNIFTFLQKYKNVTFQEALKIVADFLGIKLDDKLSKTNINKASSLYKLLLEANHYFINQLENNKFAKEYINNRGINVECIKKYKLGLCPQNIIDFKNFFNSKGIPEKDLRDVGFIITSKNQREDFLRFQNRITFPIYNTMGQIVGFGGRTIVDSKIKYINSPESLIFKKSDNIFGLWQNKESIKNNSTLFLVEGYFDVISLSSMNIKNTVATLGTSLSQTQIEKIWNYTSTPIICYDGDQAGLKAMNQLSIKILKFLKPGKTMKFMIIPNGHDPDSFVQKNGKEKFNEYSRKSLNLSDLIWRNLIDEPTNITPEYSTLIENKIREITATISNTNLSREYFKYLNTKKNNYFWSKRKGSNFSEKKTVNKIINYKKLKDLNEYIIISFLFFEKELSADFIEQIESIKFNDNLLEKEKSKLTNHYLNYQKDKKNFEEIILELDLKELEYLKETHFKNLENVQKKLFLRDIISNLRLPILIKERELLKREILSLEQKENLKIFMKKYESLSIEINKIKNK